MALKVRIWTGVAIFFVGLAVGGAMVVSMFFGIDDDVSKLHRFGADADGGAYVVDDAHGVWFYLEPQERSLAGVRWGVIDVETGDPVDLDSTRSYRQTYDMPAGSGRSIARADLAPGEYAVIVEPATVTIAMGPSPLPGFSDFVPMLVFAGPLVAVGLALALISAIQQSRRRTQEATSSLPPPGAAPASDWATGTWETPGPSIDDHG